MLKSVKHFVLFAALVGFGAAPAWAHGKSSRTREEQPSGAKADRGQGGQVGTDRGSRSQSKRGAKNDADHASSSRTATNKRKR